MSKLEYDPDRNEIELGVGEPFWVTVNGIALHLTVNTEGSLAVAVYRNGAEMDLSLFHFVAHQPCASRVEIEIVPND